MGSIRQPGFSSGELAPSMWGRTDSPRYATGLRRLYNFFVSKQGGAVTRAGTQFLGKAAAGQIDVNPSWSGSKTFGGGDPSPAWATRGGKVRLIPFHYSDTDTTQNYILEFGEHTIRIWKSGALYGGNDGTGPATIYETTGINYASADLEKIQVVQSGDVLTIACAGYAPATLTRGIDTSGNPQNDTYWVYDAIDFSRPAPNPAVELRLMMDSFGTPDASHPLKLWSWVVTEVSRNANGLIVESAPVPLAKRMIWQGLTANANAFYDSYTLAKDDAGWIQAPNPASPDPGLTGFSAVVPWSSTTTYPAGVWVLDGSGNPYTSLQASNHNNAVTNASFWAPLGTQSQIDTISGDQNVCLYPDRQLTLWIVPASTVSANFLYYRVYRGRSNVFGHIGDTPPGPLSGQSTQIFTDDGSDPNYELAPPQGIDPFDVFDPTTGALLRTETPIAVAYYEDRLGFFGTKERSTFGFLSATGDYFNFDQRLVPLDSDSTVFALAARKREIVRSALGKDRLFLLTNGGIWACGGSQGAPIGPSSIDAHLQVEIGSDLVAPLVVGDNLLWVRDKGTGVRSAAYDFARGTWTSRDLSFGSEHLVLGHRIVDWCFAEDPWGVAWAVRDDGVLLSLTYAPDEGLWAWAQHAVCVDDSGAGANGNGIGRGIQSVATIPEGDEDAVYLAVDGRIEDWTSAATYGAGALVMNAGVEFMSQQNSNHNHTPPGTGSDAWWAPASSDPPAWILRFSTRLEVPGATAGAAPIKSPICLDSYATITGLPTGGTIVLTGLAQFNGLEVMAIVTGHDGSGSPYTVAQGPYLVVSGAISVPVVGLADSFVIGLPYNCELELLDLPEGRTLQKVVNQVGLEVQAGGNVYAGSDFAHLFKHAPPAVAAVDNLIKVDVRGTWNTGGRAALRVQDPVPVTVLGVTREVARGEG